LRRGVVWATGYGRGPYSVTICVRNLKPARAGFNRKTSNPAALPPIMPAAKVCAPFL
jgi:hypothetical protein